MYKIAKVYKNATRYLVINNENSRTIEIRIFKGTLNVDTFYADLQLVNNLFKLAYDTSINIEDITFDRLIEGEYISRYCEENEIYSDARIVDDSLEYIKIENKALKSIKQALNIAFKEIEMLQDSLDFKVTIKTLDYNKQSEIEDGFSKFTRKMSRFLSLKHYLDSKRIEDCAYQISNIISDINSNNDEIMEIRNSLVAKRDKIRNYIEQLNA